MKFMKSMKIPKILLAALLALPLLLAAGCSAVSESQVETLDDKVDKVLSHMTTEEKVGQLVMIGIAGETADEDALFMLHQYHMGGVILFDRNLKTADQTKRLIVDLQKQAGQKVPLFIGIDEEGGPIVRGKDFIAPPPSEREIGERGNILEAEGSATRVAETLKDLGFNVNFAPVADVGTDERDFSGDAELVKKFVLSAAQGYEKARMIYVLKHFPGIGRGTVDTHEATAKITTPRDKLMAHDMLPFRAIIDSKQSEDYFILVSHYCYPALDKENPASLSYPIMTDLLRNGLGYRGIIITDDLEMGALKGYSFRELGVKAVLAGADIVLVCHDYDHQKEVYLGILDAVKDGTISMDHVDTSVRRIIRAKMMHRGQVEAKTSKTP